MKKLVVLCSLLATVCLAAAEVKPAAPAAPAAAPTAAPAAVAPAAQEWDILQFGFAPEYPTYQNDVAVYGFRIGAPLCGGSAPVTGVEGAVLGTSSNQINGVQFGLCAAIANEVTGLQGSFYNEAKNVNGVQLGIINVTKGKGLQLGLVNFTDGGMLPWCVLFNYKF